MVSVTGVLVGTILLMQGQPGTGTTILAARLSGILQTLQPDEASELGSHLTVAGGLRGGVELREPLLVRIDMHIDVLAVSLVDLCLPPPAETSAEISRRVAAARTRQSARYDFLPPDRRIRTNAEADGALLDEIAAPDPAGQALLQR